MLVRCLPNDEQKNVGLIMLYTSATSANNIRDVMDMVKMAAPTVLVLLFSNVDF